jgi:hypothetical protein
VGDRLAEIRERLARHQALLDGQMFTHQDGELLDRYDPAAFVADGYRPESAAVWSTAHLDLAFLLGRVEELEGTAPKVTEREAEIRERLGHAAEYLAPYRSLEDVQDLGWLLGRTAVLSVVNARLEARVAELLRERDDLRAEVAEAEIAAALGCENPPPGCDCPGCSLARDAAERGGL